MENHEILNFISVLNDVIMSQKPSDSLVGTANKPVFYDASCFNSSEEEDVFLEKIKSGEPASIECKGRGVQNFVMATETKSELTTLAEKKIKKLIASIKI